jgi:hypothetical protein
LSLNRCMLWNRGYGTRWGTTLADKGMYASN